MTASLLAALAGMVAALLWRMRVDDRRADALVAATKALGEVRAELKVAEIGQSVAEDGVLELVRQLDQEQARAAAVAAELEARLVDARQQLAKYVPRDELASVINEILKPRPS